MVKLQIWVFWNIIHSESVLNLLYCLTMRGLCYLIYINSGGDNQLREIKLWIEMSVMQNQSYLLKLLAIEDWMRILRQVAKCDSWKF